MEQRKQNGGWIYYGRSASGDHHFPLAQINIRKGTKPGDDLMVYALPQGAHVAMARSH